MTTRKLEHVCLGVLIACGATGAVQAQGLAQRVSSAPNRLVQFSYAARPGVCGNGRSFISIGESMHIGSFTTVNGAPSETCVPGPVRVVLSRDGGTITSIETYVGPLATTPGATDLGTVSSREAADYLVSLAAQLEGRPSRDAITPAMIADSANVSQQLLAVARNTDRPTETRRSAISWLGRATREPAMVPSDRVVPVLVELARNGNENQTVRNQALSTLSRLDRGDGIPPLIELSRGATERWLAQHTVNALARSGDPRAREYLRQLVQRGETQEDVRAAAIRGLGRNYASGADADFLRGLYTRLEGRQSKENIIDAIANIGGSENLDWVMGIARNEQEELRLRQRALRAAMKAELPSAELVQLYDRMTDRRLRQEVISALARRGDKETTEKLVSIARSDEDPALRRSAIQRLSRSSDPAAAQALRQIVEP
ncbi:MAG TPA: HEAT repeat domain-containing protein [Gemmatimonadaceae bacterium]|nr:HEAT repeat domain-containing protein [Gemmatimonadaceae bacterium]